MYGYNQSYTLKALDSNRVAFTTYCCRKAPRGGDHRTQRVWVEHGTEVRRGIDLTFDESSLSPDMYFQPPQPSPFGQD